MTWMCITLDKYELPVAVADTAMELARLCNVSEKTVRSSISNANKHGYRSRYIKVEDIDNELVE